MSIRSFVVSVYRFLTFPFRKLWECCFKRKEDSHQPVVKKVNKIPEPLTRIKRMKSYDIQRKVHSAPVLSSQPSKFFIDDYFLKKSEAKNDTEYHRAEHKKERIKHREKLMNKLKAEKEKEKLEKNTPLTIH
jgi:hypothetical protein